MLTLAPTITHETTFDGKDARTVKATYTLPTDDENVWRELTLTVHYNSDRHYYYADVTRCLVKREGIWISSSYNLFDGGIPIENTRRVVERGVARYSRKHLDEIAPAHFATYSNEQIDLLLEWAAGAN